LPASGPHLRASLIFGVPDERAPFILEEVTRLPSMLRIAFADRRGRDRRGGCASLARPARIIHLATHGHFREDNPLFSGIRLGDSYLTLYDLYGYGCPPSSSP